MGLPEFYKYYIDKYCAYMRGKKKYINREDPFYLEHIVFTGIIKDFNREIRDMMVYDAFKFTMPSRLGELSIGKVKPILKINEDGSLDNRFPIDRKATKELWDSDPEAEKRQQYIYHTNYHSDGFVAKLVYDKYIANYENKGKYLIQTPRTMKLMIRDVMTDKFRKHDYFLINRRKNADR